MHRKVLVRSWATKFTCFLFLYKASSAIRLQKLSTKATSYHQSSSEPEPWILFMEALFNLQQRKQWDVGQSPFPCTHKPFSLRLQVQLMNSWEPNLPHLKYYCIVHHNDGNNLVMSVHRAGPDTKPTASHTPCLCIVNTKKAFHSPCRAVTVEKVGDRFLSDILASGHEY